MKFLDKLRFNAFKRELEFEKEKLIKLFDIEKNLHQSKLDKELAELERQGASQWKDMEHDWHSKREKLNIGLEVVEAEIELKKQYLKQLDEMSMSSKELLNLIYKLVESLGLKNHSSIEDK